jgi:hypothetical protein
LKELLTAPAARKKSFYLGSNAFDADEVGFATGPSPEATIFDTSAPGNSNAGHAYGTTLGDDEKRQLLEYLKTITSDGEEPGL